jgi:hypothetical protein
MGKASQPKKHPARFVSRIACPAKRQASYAHHENEAGIKKPHKSTLEKENGE